MSEYYKWMSRAWLLADYGILPIRLTENSQNEMIRLLGAITALPWFIINLPVLLILSIPASLCVLVAITYYEE